MAPSGGQPVAAGASRGVRGLVPLRGPVESPGCGACPFAKDGKPQKPVAGIGPKDPAWIICGESPGNNEVRQGVPFIGVSGQLVEKGLAAIGVQREALWITNTMLCQPPFDASDVRKDAARAACAPRLHAELAQFPGKPVLAFGGHAAKALLGEDVSVMSVAGSLFEVGRREIIPSIHPAAILRGGSGVDVLYWNLVFDAAKVQKLATGEAVRFEGRIDVEAQDGPRASKLVEELLREAHRKVLGIDLEARPREDGRDARNPREAAITVLGIATPERAVSVAWGLLDGRARYLLAATLRDHTTIKVPFNILYDREVLLYHGFSCEGPWEDPLLLHTAAFPGLPHDLQRVVTQFFAAKPWKAEYRKGAKTEGQEVIARSKGRIPKEWPEAPGASGALALAIVGLVIEASLAIYIYNAHDALAPAKLLEPLKSWVNGTGTAKVYEMDLRNAGYAGEMVRNGVPLDLDENKKLDDRYRDEIGKAREEIERVATDPALREAFLDCLAAEQAKRARKGDPPGYLDRYKVRLRDLQACRRCYGQGFSQRTRVCGTNSKKCGTKKKPCPGETCAKCKGTGALPKSCPGATCPKCAGALRVKIGEPKTCAQCKGKGVPAFEFEPKKNDHIVAYLKARGAPLTIETEKGKTSTSKEILESLAHLPAMRPILDEREARKMKSTFIVAWRNAVRLGGAAQEGRFYAKAAVHSRAGRWRISGPNCQNIPKARSWGRPNLRAQVVAPPGKLFVGFDFKAIHPRIIALFSGDPYLARIFREERDLHLELAREVWPEIDTLDPEKIAELRDIIKRPEYCTFYLGAPFTAWQAIVKEGYPEVTLEQTERMVAVMNTRMVGVTRWHADLFRDVARPPHELRSLLMGRRACFPLGNASPNDVTNLPVLMTEVEIMSEGLRRFHEVKTPEERLLLQLHDGGVIEVPEAMAEETAKRVKATFTQEHTHRGVTIPFPVKVKIGRSWAELG